jgi:hypothetical protein
MVQIPQNVDETIEERALVVSATARLKAKQVALDLRGLSDHIPSFIIWLEESVRMFDARSPNTN